ncbi:MAG: HAMP domain-containing histidine kinase [Actinobacteria bacterium]|nr:MAG: HAMP domain-containing histidine kinase [Actinomycetota bacterium]
MRYRLVATYLVLLTLVLLALEIPLAANVAASRTQAVVIDRNADAARLASLADPALRTGETQTLTDELDRYYDLFGITAAVADRDGRLVASTGDPQVFGTPQVRGWLNQALAGERVGAGRTVWPWRHARLAIAVPVTTAGEVVGAVLTLSPVDKLQASIDRAWVAIAGGGLVAGVVFVAVAAVLARWILRPVGQLDDAAHRISAGALDARVPSGVGPPELRRLARSFNTMADDVTDALDRQRAFVAQASHQLRNPLTALRLRVEELGTFITDPAGGDEHRLALEEADRLRRICDGLLALARAERGRYHVEVEDAAVTADERVAAWQPLARERGITLRRNGSGSAPVHAVPTAVGQALDALIDNALKFSGPDATVEVTVVPDGDRVELRVVDDGPGLADALRRQATERFWRAPDAQNVDGSGLGLPIATVLVTASGGDLELLAADPRGLDARLRFPAVPPNGGPARDNGARPSPPGSSAPRRDAAAAEGC